MGTVHTVALHFRYDRYMRRLVNEFLGRNPIASVNNKCFHYGVGVVSSHSYVTFLKEISYLPRLGLCWVLDYFVDYLHFLGPKN